MTTDRWIYLLNGLAWAVLGVAFERIRAWAVARRRLKRDEGGLPETPLERFTMTIVILVAVAGVALSISTELRADSTASCVNDRLVERTKAQDAPVISKFFDDLADAYDGTLNRDQFVDRVHAAKKQLGTNQAYRDAHPFEQC